MLVYAVPTSILKRIHKFCVRNSFKLGLIDNAHTSVLPLIKVQNDAKNVLSIHIENKLLSVLLLADGKTKAYKSKAIETISNIPELLGTIIEEFNERKVLSENIDKVYASGNFINTELKKNIETKNNLTITELNPFENIEISESLKNNNIVLENTSKFITAASVALRKIS